MPDSPADKRWSVRDGVKGHRLVLAASRLASIRQPVGTEEAHSYVSRSREKQRPPPLPCRLQDVLWRAGSRTATQSITLHAFHPAAKHGKHAAYASDVQGRM
ncbi:hypothetical protein L1887_47744 [Cichorium endivia]|nr:hypothetical protein L1887_47744 [Cichorium endivia]